MTLRNAALDKRGALQKTLLVYDIAKYLIQSSRKVLIMHTAQINNGQKILREKYSWKIDSTNYVIDDDFSLYDLIIVDEAQRLTLDQFNRITQKVRDAKIHCIFSYDMKQCLTSREINFKIPDKIENIPSIIRYQLTDKIRTNKEIASFIRSLFDLKKQKTAYNYSNIEVSFFNDRKKAKRFLFFLNENGWRVPQYTPGNKTVFQYEDYLLPNEDSTHSVIGQEFDKVVGVIDEYFGYNSEGKLSIIPNSSYLSWYSQCHMLFQILTRTREKLFIVIINNPRMLSRCLDIIHN